MEIKKVDIAELKGTGFEEFEQQIQDIMDQLAVEADQRAEALEKYHQALHDLPLSLIKKGPGH